MVTYEGLFQFALVIIGIVSLVIQIRKKKWPPSPKTAVISDSNSGETAYRQCPCVYIIARFRE